MAITGMIRGSVCFDFCTFEYVYVYVLIYLNVHIAIRFIEFILKKTMATNRQRQFKIENENLAPDISIT